MRIVITECSTAANIGSMALIENAIKIARNLDLNCTITLLTSDRNTVKNSLNKSHFNDSITILNDLFLFPNGNKLYKVFWMIKTVLWIVYTRFLFLFSKKPYKLLFGRRAGVLKEIDKADYVFCIGAERINDIYYKTAYLSLEALSIYEKMGSKLIHLSLTVGPVFYKSTIRKAKKVLRNSKYIFVRDQKSFYICQEFEIDKSKVFNSYDIAILQDKLKDDKHEELFDSLGINYKNGYVCVSVIDWLFRKAKGPVRQNEYNIAVAKVLDYIIEKYNKKIVFTPTVVGIYKVDDVTAGKNVTKHMKNKNHVIEITKLLTPSELATVFSHCDFSIVTRMHAAILCTGAGNRPIIAINYLYKLREYMKNIGFEDYSIDIDYTNFEDLKRFVDNMISNYDSNRVKLSERIKIMQNKLISDINTIQK